VLLLLTLRVQYVFELTSSARHLPPTNKRIAWKEWHRCSTRLQRLSMDELEREKQLLDWTTEKCSDENEGGLDFEEGWNMIKRHGLDVLNEMLKEFLLNKDGSGRRERCALHFVAIYLSRMFTQPQTTGSRSGIKDGYRCTQSLTKCPT